MRYLYEVASRDTVEGPGLTKQEFTERNMLFDFHKAVSVEEQTEWAQSLSPPREDIAQALKVIGRRDAGQRQVEARWGKDAKPDAKWVFDLACPDVPDRNRYTDLPESFFQAH